MYCSGTPMGHNGPTAFIMKGKRRRKGIYEKYLLDEGCAVVSTVAMTENTFMTDATWEEITYQVISCLNSFPVISCDLLSQFCVWLSYHQPVKGYRRLPIFKHNPQWWMVEILDGFGAHLNNLYANQKRSENKILFLKEEG